MRRVACSIRYQEFLRILGFPEGARLVTVIDGMQFQLSEVVAVVVDVDVLPPLLNASPNISCNIGLADLLSDIRHAGEGAK